MLKLFTGKKSRPAVLTSMAKTYEIDKVDGQMAFFTKSPNGLQLMITKPLMDGVGKATVDGKEISRGIIFKFPFSPFLTWILVAFGVRRMPKETL